jgi:hypothetical protein
MDDKPLIKAQTYVEAFQLMLKKRQNFFTLVKSKQFIKDFNTVRLFMARI